MLNALNKNKLKPKLFTKKNFDNEVVDMIAEYERFTGNTLRCVGRCYVGLCPFHTEDTPSFSIYPDTNSYYCFGCQVSGTGNWLLKQLKEQYGR